MAKIKLPSYLKEGSGRMEDAVLAQWKGVNYMKPYKKPKNTNTANQESVRAAFSSLVDDWRSLSGIVRTSWSEAIEGQPLTGYNAFIGANCERRRKGEHLDLCPTMGENQVTNFAAAAGTAAGTITCSFSPITTGKHLTLFVRKEVQGAEEATILRHDCGADPASPVTVPALESGKNYTVYALVTDAVYTDAKTVSRSTASAATTV